MPPVQSQNQSQPKGWVPILCGRNSRQRADEHNLALRPTLTPINMLVRDLDTVRVRNAIRAETWRSCATWGLTLRPHRRTNRSAHICASYNGSRKWSGAKCGRRRAKLISKKGDSSPEATGVPVSHLPASAACRHRPSIKVHKFLARIAPPPFFIRPTTSDIIR